MSAIGKVLGKSEKRGYFQIFLQVILASVVAGVFFVYVWALQSIYDQHLKDNHDTKTIGLALLYVLIILGGGFAYDCGKTILSLRPAQFEKAKIEFSVALLFTIFTFVAAAGGLFFMHVNGLLACIAFIAAMCSLVGMVNHFSGFIDAVIDGD